MTETQASITCPTCQRTSYHPEDVKEGYCAFCQDWTSTPSAVAAAARRAENEARIDEMKRRRIVP